jgi:Family of unknown function (DUF5691)
MNRDPFTVFVLLGTERMGAPPVPPHAVLAEAWAALDWAARESTALSALALVAAARGAGAVSETCEPLEGAAPEETRPCCAPRAALCLRRMLGGEHAEFLPEWLDEATRRGQRAAFRDLPLILRLATRERALRPALAAVLGERGAWLARRTEGWREVLDSTTACGALEIAAWETGTPSERVAWLRQTRALDAARAAEVLAKAWGEASGEERERWLAVVAEAPTAHDVPLLEGEALRDRRREVRTTARAALLRRPESAFAIRARERVEGMVKLDGVLLNRRLVLSPPETFDAAWKTDGIEEKPPAGTGARAHWARQWLGAVPFSVWMQRFELSAEKLFALNRDEEWGEVILLGWIDAAMAAPEAANAEAFALHVAGLGKWPKSAPAPLTVLLRLIEVLEPEAAARVLAATDAGAGKAAENGLYFELLFRSEFALPEGDATRALERALEAFQAKPYPQLQSNHARALARRLPLAVATESLRRLGALPELSSPAEELLRAIEFRQQLHLAFTTSP